MNRQEPSDAPFGDFIVYADESGDHCLTKCDPKFPVFVLTFCIFRKTEYTERIVPALQRIKYKHFGHDIVIFHEREIHKSEGPFVFLLNASKKQEFMNDLSEWVEQSPFTIIGVVIRKAEFTDKHAQTRNPYHFAMRLGLERVEKYLRRMGQTGRQTHVVFEERGKKEDGELQTEFAQVCDGENYRSQRFNFRIVFASKKSNCTGLQLADLTGRPIGRHVIEPTQRNRAFEIIEAKFDRGPGRKIEGYGLKCYPEKPMTTA